MMMEADDGYGLGSLWLCMPLEIQQQLRTENEMAEPSNISMGMTVNESRTDHCYKSASAELEYRSRNL